MADLLEDIRPDATPQPGTDPLTTGLYGRSAQPVSQAEIAPTAPPATPSSP